MQDLYGFGLSGGCALPAPWRRGHAYTETQINFATVELVLMLRIWVLYGRSKRMGSFMAISFLVTIGAGLALRNVQPAVVAGDVYTRESLLLFSVHPCS
jgi:hypothetical protein